MLQLLCVCRDIELLGSLESTQEARVARGTLLHLFHVLQTSHVPSILTLCTLMHELIVKLNLLYRIYTLGYSRLHCMLENHTLHSSRYLYSQYMAVPTHPPTPPPPPPGVFPPFTHMLTTKIITDKETFMVYTTSN